MCVCCMLAQGWLRARRWVLLSRAERAERRRRHRRWLALLPRARF